jgi:type I restriction enzyme M protein
MAEDTREVVNIKVLNKSIDEIVSKQTLLREEIDRIVSEIEGT